MSTVQTTSEPHEENGKLTTRSKLPDSVFAIPNQWKELLTDAQHVWYAVARFDHVSMCQMKIERWPSQTSRKPPSTTM